MKIFVNGYSSIAGTSKEEIAAATLNSINTHRYTVNGKPVVENRWGNIYRVYIPVINKRINLPTYCVRTFRLIDMEELEKVPFIDLSERRY